MATMQASFTCASCGHQDVVEEYKSPLPSHLLETNDPPLASEEQFLREMLENSDFEREIVEMDAKLAVLEQMTAALRCRREKTVESFIAAKGVLSPIRRVPAEVIGEIVMLALTEGDGFIKATSLNMAEDPWAYSQVCRIWRKEILSRTAIWANIGIIHPKELDYRRYSADLLEATIHCSALAVSAFTIEYFDSAIAKAILAKAVEYSRQWQSVKLCLTPHLFSRLKKLKSRLPLLEVLWLVGHFANHNPISLKSIAECFRDAPALRKCRLSGFLEPSVINLPWAQLTHLNDNEDTLVILRHTPNPVFLSLRYPNGVSAPPRVRFEHLITSFRSRSS
ncbi:hypothetical protein C8J56DRAFT_922521 [Mycena floridula]|nr:hypothetical protein C8J56DRAFT_922521 [Mycena floridula]